MQVSRGTWLFKNQRGRVVFLPDPATLAWLNLWLGKAAKLALPKPAPLYKFVDYAQRETRPAATAARPRRGSRSALNEREKTIANEIELAYRIHTDGVGSLVSPWYRMVQGLLTNSDDTVHIPDPTFEIDLDMKYVSWVGKLSDIGININHIIDMIIYGVSARELDGKRKRQHGISMEELRGAIGLWEILDISVDR